MYKTIWFSSTINITRAIWRSTCYKTFGTSPRRRKRFQTRSMRSTHKNPSRNARTWIVEAITDHRVEHYRNCTRLCPVSCNVVNRCHPYAQCIYMATTGDYECRCNPGYEGDGMECAKTGTLTCILFFLRSHEISPFTFEGKYHGVVICRVNEKCCSGTEVSCLEVDICDPNASCQQEESLAKCVCNPGFEGDGTTCSAIGHITFHIFFSIFFNSSIVHFYS